MLTHPPLVVGVRGYHRLRRRCVSSDAGTPGCSESNIDYLSPVDYESTALPCVNYCRILCIIVRAIWRSFMLCNSVFDPECRERFSPPVPFYDEQHPKKQQKCFMGRNPCDNESSRKTDFLLFGFSKSTFKFYIYE